MNKLLILASVMLSTMIFTNGVVLAQDPFNNICTEQTAESTVCQQKDTTQNPLFGSSGVITRAIQIIVMLAGVASVFMIIVGGFKYMTSTGDSAKISSAKDTILYAIIGLVVTIMAQAIVAFVLTRL